MFLKISQNLQQTPVREPLFSCEFGKIFKGFVTHNDRLKIYRTTTIKIFLEYFDIIFEIF